MDTDVQLAFYVPSLVIGGAQQVTVNLANGFADHGLDVDIVVSYRRGELIDDVDDRVSIVDLGTTRFPVIGVAASIPAFTRYLRREAPDVLFSQMHYANTISILAKMIAARDTKLVVTEHNIFRSSDHRKDRLVYALDTQLYQFSDHVLAVSSGVAESVRQRVELPDDHLSVIHNPVVAPGLREKAETSVDHPWFQSPDFDVVLGVGHLIPQKDFTTLIEAFAKAQATRPSLRLVLVGDGPRHEVLKGKTEELGIEDRVSFPGFVDNQYAYMRGADVFALSSRWEGLPTVLIEAMACGTPVVATDCHSGPREILSDGAYGPLVSVGDPDALAAAIENVLRDPLPGPVLEDRADDFSVDTALDEYESLIDKLT